MLLLFVSAVAGRNFYQELGISRNADAKQIKRAYRKLSLKFHPDKNKGNPHAQEKFSQVSSAYEVLSDPEKRRVYDEHGEEGLKEGGNRGGGGDPFADIFSQMGFNMGGRRQQTNRGEDVKIPLAVTLNDLYLGREVPMLIRKQKLCPQCRGSGARSENDVKKCPHCRGKGHVIRMHQLGPGFVQQVQQPCDRCEGKGKVIRHQCPRCRGAKLETGESELDVLVEQGMTEGQEITLEHAGDDHPSKAAGHIIFVIRSQSHPVFTREGDDLKADMTITLREALTGFTRYLTHLDGRQVTIRRTAVTKPGQVIELRDEGMPVHNFPSQKGNLFVTITVAFPERITKEQRQGLLSVLPYKAPVFKNDRDDEMDEFLKELEREEL